MTHCDQQPNRGFTLIELMVSITLFIIVMFVAVGALLMLVQASSVAFESQAVTDNLSFVVDSMTREIRTGYDFRCSWASDVDTSLLNGTRADCSAPGKYAITFNDGQTGHRLGYRFDNTTHTIERAEDTGVPIVWVPLTSNENVTVNDVRFIVAGTSKTDKEQPHVSILVKGTDNSGAPSTYYLQSSVVQRVLDL